jgi:hypothetical protein
MEKERQKLVEMLRKVTDNTKLDNETVLIPEDCPFLKEGEYDIQTLLYFIADMIE